MLPPTQQATAQLRKPLDSIPAPDDPLSTQVIAAANIGVRSWASFYRTWAGGRPQLSLTSYAAQLSSACQNCTDSFRLPEPHLDLSPEPFFREVMPTCGLIWGGDGGPACQQCLAQGETRRRTCALPSLEHSSKSMEYTVLVLLYASLYFKLWKTVVDYRSTNLTAVPRLPVVPVDAVRHQALEAKARGESVLAALRDELRR